MKYTILITVIFFTVSCSYNTNQEVITEDNNIENNSGTGEIHKQNSEVINTTENINLIKQNNIDLLVKNLNSEIENLNEEIKKLESSNKKLEDENSTLKENFANSKKNISIKGVYGGQNYNSRSIDNIINIETKNNNIIIKLHDNIITSYDVSQIDDMYEENNSKHSIDSLENRINDFVNNKIHLKNNILKINQPFPEEGSLLDFLNEFYIDEKNGYFYEITGEGISTYVTSYKDKHFIYTWGQAERAIYKLEGGIIQRLNICGEAFGGKWYKPGTFSVNKDGTYNFECD